MDLHVSLTGRRDLSGQLYRQIRAAILDGQLRAGDALPPTRELAGRLAVARNTVAVAYERLAAEGFLVGRVGAGTFVRADLPELPGRRPARRPPTTRAPRPRPVWEEVPVPAGLGRGRAEFDFRPGLPDARLFPYQTWRRLVADQLRSSVAATGRYGDPAGHAGLRAAIARHVAVSRAVRATPDEVVITNGVQHAVDLIGRVLVPPGDCVAVEDPGYPPPYWLFRSLGARVAPVPVDHDGLVVDALPDDARLVYVTPSHQFPLGVSMSLPRRMALLAWAYRHGAVVLEDDYDSEFRFTGRPVEPLQSLDRTGSVIYLGSFSKVLLPSLRLGFAVVPPSLHPAVRAARYVADGHSPVPIQAALARFIEEGRLARHIRRMRHEYRERHLRIAEAIEAGGRDRLELVPSVAGIHVSAYLPAGTDPAAVVRSARAVGVAVDSLRAYASSPAVRPGLVLGYGRIPADRIGAGVARLSRCL
ncbi:MAG: aminotransferase class I/II-fold pyridoxal phosphate-dependent enzyme [Micromonosporaceae bacterium]|nr:aminotransferase class I/II-fold pyridoxal phosphate-dependent enzyme [Micromonosporaceae bacterium]